MSKGQRSNREIRKPKKTAAQRSSEQPATLNATAALLKQQKDLPKRKG